MKNRTVLSAVLPLCLLSMAALPAMALTPPALKVSDGTNTVTIDASGVAVCSGSCTTAAASGVAGNAGSVSWKGTVGSFTISASQGQSRSALFPGFPHLAIIAINNSSAQGTLTATWSDVGYTARLTSRAYRSRLSSATAAQLTPTTRTTPTPCSAPASSLVPFRR